MRRRRPPREIAFSFDSFLDVVANVVGIILRLILVAWVGARTYRAVTPPPPPEPAALAELASLPEPTDPRLPKLQERRELVRNYSAQVMDRQKVLEELRALQASAQDELKAVLTRRQTNEAEKKKLESATQKKAALAQEVTLSAEELQARSRKLLAEIEALRKTPTPKKALRYRTPVSKPLQTEQVMFECRHGRVTLIDTGALLEMALRGMREKSEQLRNTWEVVDTTAEVGPFRMRYTVERERTALDRLAAVPPDAPFHYGISGWEIVPIVEERGETVESALKDGSAFHKVVDSLDAQQTAVTFWVYADSFPLYRRLRDYLHDRDVVVAGRPLLEGLPIASRKDGTASRGQ